MACKAAWESTTPAGRCTSFSVRSVGVAESFLMSCQRRVSAHAASLGQGARRMTEEEPGIRCFCCNKVRPTYLLEGFVVHKTRCVFRDLELPLLDLLSELPRGAKMVSSWAGQNIYALRRMQLAGATYMIRCWQPQALEGLGQVQGRRLQEN